MRQLAASNGLSPILVLAALVAPAGARANGFALDIQGLFSNGTASAGAASARDPAGQFANPAVLATLEGTQVVVGGMVIAPRAPYSDHGSTLLDGSATLPGANGDGGRTGTVPWVFASHRLSQDVSLGFALASPFGLSTDYGRGAGFVGRYQGVESRIEAIAFGPAVAWKATDRLAIGLGVAARRDTAVVGQALDLGSICAGQAAANGDPDPVGTCAGLGYVPGASDGYARYSGNGWGWTLSGGATFEAVPGTTLGVAYRRESKGRVKGHETFDAAAQGFLGFAGEPGAKMDLAFPDFLTVSAAQRVGRTLSLLAAFQYSFWGRFDTVELVPDDPANGLSVASKQGFRNAFRVSAGAVWSVRPGLELFGGAAFEQSPITDRYRQASLPERDSVIVGAGAEAALWRSFTVGAAYQRVQMIGSSHVDQAGATGDRLVGSVRGSADVATVQLGWRPPG
ncbi:MAG TPA: outer membrane protein transport protein [Anaeromyxobacter sp.]